MSASRFSFDRISAFFILQWGWKRSLTAFIAGGVSALAMPPTDWFWLLFITFPVFIWLLDGTAGDPGKSLYARLKPSFIVGWWFSYGFFLAGHWWIGAAMLVESETYGWVVPVAVLGVPMVLSICWAVVIALTRLWWSEDWKRIVLIAGSIAMAEYFRGALFPAFPWNTIGYAALSNPLMMQSASLIGIYGITPLAIMVFASPAIFAPGLGKKPRRVRALLSVCLVLVIAHVGFGYWRLSSNPPEFVEGVQIRIVQPAIEQKEKWKPENEEYIFNSYLELSAGEDNSKITHYVWPESAFPFLLTQRRDALGAIAELLPDDTYLITGAMRAEAGVADVNNARVFNSVYVINHNGEIVGANDKTFLVPFGEFLPFQELAEKLGLRQITGVEGGFTPGVTRNVLSTKTGGKMLPLICYEIVFSGEITPDDVNPVREGGKKNEKPDWIVNVTNDAWFGKTAGPYQHHRQSVVRGVEEGLPVVRAANSGISSVSDAYGRIHAFLPLGERGSLDSRLPKPVKTTQFQIFGNWPFWIICIFMLIISVRRKSA